MVLKQGFGKVAGIEYREDLCSYASTILIEKNIDATVIQADASIYDEYDDYNYFYLYNPFDESIMIQFVFFLDKSIARRKRKITVIYVNAKYQEVFTRMGYKVYKKNN